MLKYFLLKKYVFWGDVNKCTYGPHKKENIYVALAQKSHSNIVNCFKLKKNIYI